MAYEQVELLKESEKSRVCLVFDTEAHRMVVEKRLRGEQAVYETLLTLGHPYLPELYTVEREDGATIVREEYIPGGSLAGVQAGEKQIVAWLLELCDVLDFLHGHGILHRDIKPSNLLLGTDGHIRLIDFDAARAEKPGAETDTQLLGTRGYAPPEQYGFAQTDKRADVYALGITVGQLLGDKAKKRRYRRLLARCTALDVKRRYRSARGVKWAVYRGRLNRLILRPLLALVLAVALLYGGVFLYLLNAGPESDAGQALRILLTSRRDTIFETVDLDRLQRSDVELLGFSGDITTSYQKLAALRPDLNFIFTGFADETGLPLFGGFSTRYEIDTGKTYYASFEGLFLLDWENELRTIPPEDCAPYAPAVVALYRLDTFETPLV